jgi:putative ABC transport system substrate-binding protein
MVSRRQLFIALGAVALASPLTPRAQPATKVWRIGSLWERDPSEASYTQRIADFKAGMRELGYVENRDYVIEHRSAHNDLARLPALAAELLALKVDLIIATGTPSALAARNATRAIPILIVTVVDPVGTGLVTSLSHPGGNITGLTQDVGAELYTKRLDLLRQILPGMRYVGLLQNPDNFSAGPVLRQFESDCAKVGLKPLRATVRKKEEIAGAFNALKRDQAQGLVVAGSGTNLAWRDDIIAHAAKLRLPAMYPSYLFTDRGGLISYGANVMDLYRRVAVHADKIFKGAKSGDLPIEQPTKFEMVINMKTAKALGIKIPDIVTLRADQVIE